MIGDDKLLPFRDYDEHEVVNLFALDGLAVAGTLVSANTFNPMNDMFSYQPVGYQHAGVTSYRFVNANKVVVATSGDTKYTVLGATLYDVKEVDDNGIPLVFNRKLAEQKEIVISGETVPVLRRGLIRLTPNAYNGTPAVNSIGVAGLNGKIELISQTDILWTGINGTGLNSHPTFEDKHVVGKCISTTGTQFSGNCYFLLAL